MTADDVARALRSALETERDAIRRLDVAAVEEASKTKEEILAAIRATPPSERAGLMNALAPLRSDLRRNLVLLAHARDSLRGALESARKTRVSTEL